MVSIKRLQNFMMFDEAKSVNDPANKESEVSDKIPRGSIRIKEGSAKWLENAEENTLSSINMRIEPGQLIAVVGQVGSGKSSLLHAILSEMSLNSGSIEVFVIPSFNQLHITECDHSSFQFILPRSAARSLTRVRSPGYLLDRYDKISSLAVKWTTENTTELLRSASSEGISRYFLTATGRLSVKGESVCQGVSERGEKKRASWKFDG